MNFGRSPDPWHPDIVIKCWQAPLLCYCISRFVLVFVVVFFTPWFTFFWLLFCCLFLVCAFRFSCGVIVICVWMLSAFVRCVLAICAIVCCSVCMHAVVQCFALVRGVDSVAIFIVPCAFFCPEHVCGCSLSDVCVCVLVALVRTLLRFLSFLAHFFARNMCADVHFQMFVFVFWLL